MNGDAAVTADEAAEGEGTEEGAGTRWSWVSWLLALTVALPLALSVASVHRIVADDRVVEAYTGYQDLPVVFADRWRMVLTFTATGWSTTTSALGALVLAAVVAGGRPAWLVVPRQRLVVGVLAAACAVWAAGTAAVSAWTVFRGPTVWEETMALQGYERPSLLDWSLEGALSVVAVVVAAAAVALCRTTRGGQAPT